MKIKRELAMALLFSINAGILILAMCSNVVKHQWMILSTNSVMLLVSIYFITYFIDIVLNRTTRSATVLSRAVDLLTDISSDMLEYSKELIRKATSKPNIALDIVCDDEKYMPRYANLTDACMDLKIKIQIEDKEKEIKTDCYFLKPNETQVFSTGIKVSIPQDYAMLIYPRSSTGFKLHCMLTNTTGIIDAGYRDEVKLAITNFGTETICLKDGQRIAQFMIIQRPQVNLNLVEDNEDFRTGDRGGGAGSTGE